MYVLPNHVWRYAPIVEWFDRTAGARSGQWLEVGSGSQGIGPHMHGPFNFTGCDLSFEPSRSERMKPVLANALKLPFSTAVFDGVLALDMLEHVAPNHRSSLLSELARVSRRWLIIGFPTGSASEKVDKWLSAFYAWRKISIPAWLEEHLQHRYPIRHDLVVRGWQLRLLISNENVIGHLAGMMLETRYRYIRVIRAIYARHPTALRALSRLFDLPPAYRVIGVLELTERPG